MPSTPVTYRRIPIEIQAVLYDGEQDTRDYMVEHYGPAFQAVDIDGFPFQVESNITGIKTRIDPGQYILITGQSDPALAFLGENIVIMDAAQFNAEYVEEE